jgi:hypothetical protein
MCQKTTNHNDAQNSYSNHYQGYAGLPTLVGLHTMSEAKVKGLPVHEAVSRLKRLHWAMKRLHGIFVARIASTPIYELKMAFSLHAHYCAEHVSSIATRIREMREPPYGLDEAPNAALDLFFDEVNSSPDLESLLIGVYEYAVPHICRGFNSLLSDTNKLFDHPTYRVARFASMEFEDINQYGRKALKCLLPEEKQEVLDVWRKFLGEILAVTGVIGETSPKSAMELHRKYSLTPRPYDGAVRRDSRFIDPYNMGVNAEAMLFDTTIPPLPKVLMLYFKRLREIDVPEMMSSILSEVEGKPWGYYRDMTRQLWDEARHAMMGELGFVSIGIDWTGIPFNITWSNSLNTQLTPLERHAVLFTIEQGLMPKKNGKENEWEIAVASTNKLSALIQDYDWADEILHARIGRDWLVPELGSQAESLAFGNAAWSKILVDWRRWKEEGLTEHRNWWPEIYRIACEHWKIEPDPALLAYNTTYENTRPDLKQIAG